MIPFPMIHRNALAYKFSNFFNNPFDDVFWIIIKILRILFSILNSRILEIFPRKNSVISSRT